jgi:DNA repair protein RadC
MQSQNVLPFKDADNRFAKIPIAELSAIEQASVIELAINVLEQRHRPGQTLSSPDATRDYLQLLLAERRNEVFGMLLFDNRNRVLAIEELFQGTLDGASVYSRVIVQKALEHNAGAVIFFHNHPSGLPEPSRADEAITQRLTDALKLIDVRVFDHIIVGTEGTVSFAERGLL